MTPEDRTELPQPLPPSTSATDSRRRLLRGGLAAAPALLTLATRPVVAGDCFSASAAVSMSSRTTANRVSCTRGKTPAAWIKKGSSGLGDWPADVVPESKGPGQPEATTFNSVFGTGYSTVPPTTLLNVLSLSSDTGRDGLAKHLVAAYLNALKNYTPPAVLDVLTAKNIWTSFETRGFYEPSAGIKWFLDRTEPASSQGGLIAWIKTTMPI